MIQAYRVPAWLEQSANAPGVDPKAIEVHNRLNGALESGDVMEGLRLMREAKPQFLTVPDFPKRAEESPTKLVV